MEIDESPAVCVRNAYKWYSRTNILNGLNMTVPQGTIYALLGPSGCGKTTLLRSILNREDLDEGTIETTVSRRVEIGYMPQEIALQEDISVDETLLYYGRIYGMGKEAIMDAKTHLFPLLNLSSKDKIVRDMSGGQKRRLSFAVALLHDPELLILDEPTVGVDPVLRSALWDYLNKISSKGKTIIITTHYIEEACQAHVVGLMRGGTLLAESSPVEILKSGRFDRLEDAFLNLCCGQEIVLKERPVQLKARRKGKSGHIKENNGWSLTRLWGQLVKNHLWFKRNLLNVFWLLFLPVLLTYLVNIIYGTKPGSLNIGIVTDEITKCSQASKAEFEFDSCLLETRPLSCAYKDILSKETVISREYSSVDQARSSMVPDRLWGIMHFKDNFTKSLLERLTLGLSVENETVDSSTVDVWMDMSDAWVSRVVKIHIHDSFRDLIKTIIKSCNYSEHNAKIPPIWVHDAIFGLNDPIHLHHALPCVLVPFIFYMALIFTMASIMSEKRTKTLDRCLSAGLTFKEVIGAHVVTQTIVLWLQIGASLAISYLIYTNPMVGDFWDIILLYITIEAVGVAFGFILALVHDNENLATYSAVCVIISLFTLAGVVWPHEGMYVLLRDAVWAVPVLPSIKSYSAIAQRGWGLGHPVVYYGLLQNTVWAVILSVSSYITFKIRQIGKQ